MRYVRSKTVVSAEGPLASSLDSEARLIGSSRFCGGHAASHNGLSTRRVEHLPTGEARLWDEAA